jgi:hypothetical protein
LFPQIGPHPARGLPAPAASSSRSSTAVFSVVAFDPCEAFVLAARRIAETSSERAANTTVVRASYRDLVRAAGEQAGPLSFLRDEARFDAVVLGWGSLSHVSPASERLALFQALHALAPGAPVLASFLLEPDTSASPGSKGRVRDALRRVFATLGAPGPSEAGDHFYPDAGFLSNLPRDEIANSRFAPAMRSRSSRPPRTRTRCSSRMAEAIRAP